MNGYCVTWLKRLIMFCLVSVYNDFFYMITFWFNYYTFKRINNNSKPK